MQIYQDLKQGRITHRQVKRHLNDTIEAFLILNDIIKLINKSLSVQIAVLSLLYFVIGIFSVFGVFEAFVERKSNFLGVAGEYFYFMVLTHLTLLLICIINVFIEGSVSVLLIGKNCKFYSKYFLDSKDFRNAEENFKLLHFEGKGFEIS